MLAQLVLNTRSRRGHEAAPQVRDALARAGITVVEDGWPAEIAPEADCIISAGGDGTLLRTIDTAIARGLPIGVIPLGTFNELARTLELPLDIEGAVRTIAAAHERTIDVARVNGTPFVNEASIGISSRITRLQTPELKQRFGAFGIVATAFQAFRHARPIHVDVEHDGECERLRTVQLTVANSHRFGGLVSVADAAIDDGWLDLYSVDIRSLHQAFAVARAIFGGKRTQADGLRTIRARAFTLRTKHAHRITADGEPAGVTPARFELEPKALRVYVPQ
ncbi:MAG: YegS/Rv2252/BmrU family lipid kinase [bacterium]|nr:YegS/Rv2252/BmrU family lipid kinase [bacterium]